MTMHDRDLHRENIELRHKLDSLLAELERRGEPLPCDLTPSEEIIARLLRSRSPNLVTRDVLHAALYAYRSEADEPDVRAVEVILSHARKKMRDIGIAIENEWARGWRMNAASAAQWDKLAKARKR